MMISSVFSSQKKKDTVEALRRECAPVFKNVFLRFASPREIRPTVMLSLFITILIYLEIICMSSKK